MQTAFIRYMLVVAFFIFWIGAVSVRLVHLQINEHSQWKVKAATQRQYSLVTKSLRGSIYDRNGNALAMSVRSMSLSADPSLIINVEGVSRDLAKILGKKTGELASTIETGKKDSKRFVWLAREIPDEKVTEIRERIFQRDDKSEDDLSRGLVWVSEQKRDYPHGSLAAHVIGFSNSDDIGKAGIEKSQEEYLKAETLRIVRQRDRQGRIFAEKEVEKTPAKDVRLTISKEIQYMAEVALKHGVIASKAKSGKAIVMDPKTGEILAMANYPTFDPSDFRDLKPGSWRNSAIQDQYAPGSVFKLITYGAALDKNLIKIDGEVDCGNGSITIGGHTFNDSHAVGNVSYIEAMAQSSNVGAIKTGNRIGKNQFYNFARKFGFGATTDIKLPSEAKGVLRDPANWSGTDLASLSIGYGVDVTALQTAVAFATIANDGVRVAPRIVKSIEQNGTDLETYKPVSSRIVTTETARALKVMLKEVVNDGTAKQAKLNGYTSAGKTGTAWKYDGGQGGPNSAKYISSFVGFAPADNPAVVIAVIIDEPKGAMRNGGQVAGPIFRDIAESILPEMRVAPDGVFEENIVSSEKAKSTEESKTNSDSTKIADEKAQKANPKALKKPEKKPEKKDDTKKKKTPKELKAALTLPEGIRTEISPHLRI